MNPAYLLSEWGFSVRSGCRLRDRWRLARSALLVRLGSQSSAGREYVRFRFNDRQFKVALRRGTTDAAVLMQVFHYGEYDTRSTDWSRIETVVDAGANIGLTSLFCPAPAPRA